MFVNVTEKEGEREREFVGRYVGILCNRKAPLR